MHPNVNLENVEALGAEEVLSVVLSDPGSRACVTCSFQAEDMIVLRMLKARRPEIPVLFLDTGYHFPETYQYRDRMKEEWALNLTNVLPKNTVEQQESLLGILHRTDPTQCNGEFQARIPDGGSQPLRALVYRPAQRAVANEKKSQKSGAASLAGRQDSLEGESSRRLDVGASVGIHGGEQPQLSSSI